jgi:hypothetical protein
MRSQSGADNPSQISCFAGCGVGDAAAGATCDDPRTAPGWCQSGSNSPKPPAKYTSGFASVSTRSPRTWPMTIR